MLINEEAEDIVTDRQEVKGSAKRSALARLINKVYGIDPLICKKCGSKMLIVAFIMDPDQIDKIMQHLKKQGRPLSDIPVLRGTCTIHVHWAPPGIAQSSSI